MIVICLLILGGTWLFMIAFGLARRDIRSIKTTKLYRDKPHARRWRNRPIIEIIRNETLLPSALARLRRSYRKVQLTDIPSGNNLVLSLPNDSTIPATALPSAVHEFNDNPSLEQLVIMPIIERPKTLTTFLHMYAIIISAPVTEAMNELFTIKTTLLPIISKQAARHNTTRAFVIYSLSWLSGIVFLYFAIQLALVTKQPTLLLALLVAFAVWSLWAIGRYPGLAFRHKFLITTLLPASFWYLLCLYLLLPAKAAHRFAMAAGAIIKV